MPRPRAERAQKTGRVLTAREAAFVDEYLVDLNGSAAAARAGYAPGHTRRQAVRLLALPEVQAAIAVAQDERAKRTRITQDMVLRHWEAIATVDVREIIEYRRSSCLKCWPEHERVERINPECRHCLGDGHGRPFIHDTRTLSPGAAKLYAGVQVGKDGIKALIEAREKAWENIARHLGMFKEKVEVTGKDGAPMQTAVIILPSNGRD
jgi:phage terminase small subunit